MTNGENDGAVENANVPNIMSNKEFPLLSGASTKYNKKKSNVPKIMSIKELQSLSDDTSVNDDNDDFIEKFNILEITSNKEPPPLSSTSTNISMKNEDDGAVEILNVPKMTDNNELPSLSNTSMNISKKIEDDGAVEKLAVPKISSDEQFPSLHSTLMNISKTNENVGAVEKLAVPKISYNKQFPPLSSTSIDHSKKYSSGLKSHRNNTRWVKALVKDLNFGYVHLPYQSPKSSWTPTKDTDTYVKCYLNDGKTNEMVKRCVHFGPSHFKLIHKGNYKTSMNVKVMDKAKIPKKKRSGKRREKYKNMINRKNRRSGRRRR